MLNFLMKNSLAITAIFISLGSLFIALKSYSVSEKSYLLNLEPILQVDTKIHNGNRDYELLLFNDGPNAISDVRIRMKVRVFNTDMMIDAMASQSTKIINSPSWAHIDRIEPNELQSLKITYEELENTYKFLIFVDERNDQTHYDPIHSLIIEYRTEPSKKVYTTYKYLLLGKDTDGNLFVSDLDKIPIRGILQMKKQLIEIDSGKK